MTLFEKELVKKLDYDPENFVRNIPFSKTLIIHCLDVVLYFYLINQLCEK